MSRKYRSIAVWHRECDLCRSEEWVWKLVSHPPYLYAWWSRVEVRRGTRWRKFVRIWINHDCKSLSWEERRRSKLYSEFDEYIYRFVRLLRRRQSTMSEPLAQHKSQKRRNVNKVWVVDYSKVEIASFRNSCAIEALSTLLPEKSEICSIAWWTRRSIPSIVSPPLSRHRECRTVGHGR